MTETLVWGLKKPETPEEEETFHEDIQGALIDLEELGFSVVVVNSYGHPVVVIQRKRVFYLGG